MRLQKVKENEEVQHFNFLDFIDCGACYLLTEWCNRKNAAVTLSQNTILEDLHEKHGGSIHYKKFCSKTFHLYESMNRSLHDEDLDKVINRTEIHHNDEYYYTQLLKTLITEEGLERLVFGSHIVRWAKEGSSRGENWYRLLDD